MKDQDRGAGRPGDAPLRLVVFGPDASEAAQIRRVGSYIDSGFDVTGFMMRRANMNPDFAPFWPNVHLGDTKNEKVAGRVAAIAKSLLRVAAHRRAIAGADVIVARNLDMLALAAAAQAMARARAPLIYECLDIHSLMTAPGPRGGAVRRAERYLLRRTAALIVSSPAFVRQYFAPVQGWEGPVALVENKLRLPPNGLPRPDPPAAPDLPDWGAARPLVLGWVGTLRCAASLDLLAAAAAALGPRLKVALHGIVHRHALPCFDDVLDAQPNMEWHGAYDYPDDLGAIYGSCDLVWSQDLWQWGTNSTWLLPNRIYEASYFGCPSLAVEGSETGRRVAAGLGWTIPIPDADALVALLGKLTPAEVAARRRALLARPASEFSESAEEIAAAIRLPLEAPDADRGPRAGASVGIPPGA